MGSKKSRLLDSINEGEQIGKEAVEAGEQLEGDGSEIKSLLDGIDTSMDEDDTSAVRGAETGYSRDFQSAFKENVRTRAEDMKKMETAAVSESDAELAKVNDAAEKFEQISDITDVGRSNANGGADSMRSSAKEYEEYIDKANDIIEETDSEVNSLESTISSIFG